MVAFDTVFPADSLEFCPTPGLQDIFVCGTYKLDDQAPAPPIPDDVGSNTETVTSTKVPQTRRGQCLVFRVKESAEGLPFQQIQSIDLPAVLDMKWCHRDSPDAILGIADSEGNVTLHEWQKGSLHQLDSVRCASSDVLCLSLDWSNKRTGGTGLGSLVVSLSNGSLCLLSPVEGCSLSVTETWHAHDYEPWIAAWNYWDTNIIYSGGDDLKMKAWDIRQGFAQPTFVNKRFEAGITSIQSHPHIEHLLAVGSYNNSVQLFDVRKPLTPVTQADVGGGAWRVKWHPSEARKHDLLVACMHDGFKVIRFGDPDGGGSLSGQPETVKRFDEHESLAYGVDWSYAPPIGNGETVVGSCSFYDHEMNIWSG
ncbi:WD40-repeat-containing domain protein [Crassisporium funariophilum]|nr:WD40-repeat-containing domain protein [Crassisporium funariophilum]